MTERTKKQPHQCKNLQDLRNEIDSIDIQILDLLKERFEYVMEVPKYKQKDAESIIAIDRKQSVIRTRADWAKERGLSGEVIGKIYEQLVNYFIEEEMKTIKQS